MACVYQGCLRSCGSRSSVSFHRPLSPNRGSSWLHAGSRRTNSHVSAGAPRGRNLRRCVWLSAFSSADTWRLWDFGGPVLLERWTIPHRFMGAFMRGVFVSLVNGHSCCCQRHPCTSPGYSSVRRGSTPSATRRHCNRGSWRSVPLSRMIHAPHGSFLVDPFGPVECSGIGLCRLTACPDLWRNSAASGSMRMDCGALAVPWAASRRIHRGNTSIFGQTWVRLNRRVLSCLSCGKCSALNCGIGLGLCSCLLTCNERSGRSSGAAWPASGRRSRGWRWRGRWRCVRICAGARISAAGTSALSVLTAGGITGSFRNGVADPFDNCIGYHSGQTTAKSVAGYGRIQAHTGNDPVYFSGDPGNSYD